MDLNGPAVCRIAQTNAQLIAECEPPLNSPPVIAPGPPRFIRCGTVVPDLPLGAGGPPPPIEVTVEVDPHKLPLGAGGRPNKMLPVPSNPEDQTAP